MAKSPKKLQNKTTRMGTDAELIGLEIRCRVHPSKPARQAEYE